MCWVLVPFVGFILGIIMICSPPPPHTHPKSNNCLGVKFVCATSLRVSVGVPAQHSLSIWNVLGWWLKCYLYSYDDANFQVCAFMIVAFSSSTFCVQEGGGCLGYVHIYTYQFWRLAGLTDPQHWQHDFKMWIWANANHVDMFNLFLQPIIHFL